MRFNDSKKNSHSHTKYVAALVLQVFQLLRWKYVSLCLFLCFFFLMLECSVDKNETFVLLAMRTILRKHEEFNPSEYLDKYFNERSVAFKLRDLIRQLVWGFESILARRIIDITTRNSSSLFFLTSSGCLYLLDSCSSVRLFYLACSEHLRGLEGVESKRCILSSILLSKATFKPPTVFLWEPTDWGTSVKVAWEDRQREGSVSSGWWVSRSALVGWECGGRERGCWSSKLELFS